VKATFVTGPFSVQIYNGSELLTAVALAPDEFGNAGKIVTFEPAVSSPNLIVKLGSDVTFSDPAGKITVECAELLEYLPENFDLALVLRLSACREGLAGSLDGDG